MTAPIRRPSEWATLGNHDERIRILEAICCGSSGDGFDQAVAIRDRSCFWFGLGDGFTTDDSVVKDYQDGGDGALQIDSESALETGTPGTIGESVEITHVWPLAQDLGSFAGFQKDFCNLGGYAPDPYVSVPVDCAIGTGSDWTINVWFRWDTYSIRCIAAAKSYGTSAIWGNRAAGDIGIWLSVSGGVVSLSDPDPDPILSIQVGTSAGITSVSAGIVEAGRWYMATVTYEVSSVEEVSLYIDGGLIGSEIVAVGTGLSDTPILIGSTNFGGFLGSNYGTWAGLLDELGAWVGDCGEALSGSDVALLYDAGGGPTLVTAAEIDSASADCGQPLVADGSGGAAWGNPCANTGVFVMPGSPTAQDVVDALIAMGLVTQ